MKRQHLLAVLALAAVTGCGADNLTSIQVKGRALSSDPKTCKFTPGGEYILGNGTYDTLVGGNFGIVLYVRNNLVNANSINPSADAEANAWFVEAARVRVNPSDYVGAYKPSPALASITGDSVLPATGPVVEPAGGESTVAVNLLSDGIFAALQSVSSGGQVVLGVTLKGRTADGKLDSAEWFFPLEICAGCLSAPASCPTGQTLVVNACPVGQLGVAACQ